MGDPENGFAFVFGLLYFYISDVCTYRRWIVTNASYLRNLINIFIDIIRHNIYIVMYK